MTCVSSFADDLRLAHVLADAVEGYTQEMFRSTELAVSVKDDGTLVTQADRHTEELLRHQLGRTRTRDVVQGEELATTGHGHRRWVLDPIDGTANFIRGVPVWATLIGLVVDDQPVLGLVSAPALARRWWAASGSGAWTGRRLSSARRIQVSDTSVLEHASLSHAALDKWWDHPQRDGFLALARRCWRTRGYGDFWSHVLVAEGAVDVSCEPEVSLWDLAALQVVVEEAGGRFTDLSGAARPDGGSVVCTNGLLHERVLEALAAG